MSNELVEKVARAICAADPECGAWEGCGSLLRRQLRDEARAALRVVREALAEPDEAMQQAGDIGLSFAGVDNSTPDDAVECWLAMLAASPLGRVE